MSLVINSLLGYALMIYKLFEQCITKFYILPEENNLSISYVHAATYWKLSPEKECILNIDVRTKLQLRIYVNFSEIRTRYGIYVPGCYVRWGRDFPDPFTSASRATQTQ
jgi:hypothetical protein